MLRYLPNPLHTTVFIFRITPHNANTSLSKLSLFRSAAFAQPLNVILTNKLNRYTISTECVVEIQPLTLHRLQDRRLLWMGTCNRDKFPIIRIKVIQRRIVWELFKRIL